MSNIGFHTTGYKFFQKSKDAIATFNSAFGKMVSTDGNFRTGCYGGYGGEYTRFTESHSADTYGNWYFCLGAETEIIEKAVEYFNSQFQNIEIKVVAKTEIGMWRDSWSGSSYYNLEYGTENRPGSPMGSYNMYMFRILFKKEYHPLARYLLRIPVAFWLRCFSDYHYSHDNRPDQVGREHSEDLIQEALDWSNSKPGSNGALISDYTPVSRELFMSMDDIELMNRYFSEPRSSVKYSYGSGSLMFGSPVMPYCVYHVIEHNGSNR